MTATTRMRWPSTMWREPRTSMTSRCGRCRRSSSRLSRAGWFPQARARFSSSDAATPRFPARAQRSSCAMRKRRLSTRARSMCPARVRSNSSFRSLRRAGTRRPSATCRAAPRSRSGVRASRCSPPTASPRTMRRASAPASRSPTSASFRRSIFRAAPSPSCRSGRPRRTRVIRCRTSSASASCS